MKYKRLIAGFMSLVFCLCVTVPSFAFTDEEWEGDEYLATSSDAVMQPMTMAIVPMADTNYVMTATYTNGLTRSVTLVKGQRFAIPKVADGAYIKNLAIEIPRYKLPAAGTYYTDMHIENANINWFPNVLSVYYYYYTYQPNTTNGVSEAKAVKTYSGGMFAAGQNASIGYKTTAMRVVIFLPWDGDVYKYEQLDGIWQGIDFNLRKEADAPSGTAPDVSTGSGSASAIQIEQGQQMIEQQENIIEQIINTTQTISNQLTAFWNQLAGEFTNLYDKMNQQHDEKLNADRENTEDIINELGDNTTTIINNNNENTEKITNGYDNSGMTSDNEKLGNSMKEQEQQEQQIMDQISGPMNDFEFDNPIVQYLSTFQLMGNFLQNLFTGSGGMQDAINLSFLLGIALMVAGLYRFKGGN